MDLEGITAPVYDSEGKMCSCRLEAYNEIETQVGRFIPHYDEISPRTKMRPSLCFFPDGQIKSIYLEKQTSIHTPLGEIEAEMVTFYNDGKLHRVFPLYGQISGFWSEEEESALAKKKFLEIGTVSLTGKIECYAFYPSGKLKSLTLWQGESSTLKRGDKHIKIRCGIAFYEDGCIKSVEPFIPLKVETMVGTITAYDNNPLGIHGDCNSLVFDKRGQIKSVKTISTRLYAKDITGQEVCFSPEWVTSQIDIEKKVIQSITLEFDQEQLVVTDHKGIKHNLKWPNYHFKTEEVGGASSMCHNGDCSNCQGCV